MMNDQSSIVDLLKNLRDDTTNLVRDEISLAKTEISEKISSASRTVGYLAAGTLVAYAGLVLFLQGVGFLDQETVDSGRYERGQRHLARLLHRRRNSLRNRFSTRRQSLRNAQKNASPNQNR